jgi:hypothetical protein
MSRNEYDANAGLKEGRRVNPGPAKVPVDVMTPGWQWFLIGTAAILALAFLVEGAPWLFHMFRPLFGSITD